MQAATQAIAFQYLAFNDSGLVATYRIQSLDGRMEYFPASGGTIEQIAFQSDFAAFMAEVNARTTDPGTGDWWNDGGYIRGRSPVPSTVLLMENGIGLAMENGTVLSQEGA